MSRRNRTARDAAEFITERLRESGHTALLAGGCVRDMLLSREPKDYDVATDATPEDVGGLFPRARRVGAQFGVMLVRKFGHDVEVATFRTDGDYSDGRHPDRVSFGTPEEDARRRDFTINGLFFDPVEERVIDYVGGRRDLDARVIRTVGDPQLRFREDHLRLLRAVRFAANLDFEIEPATFEAMRRLADRLPVISPERVWIELDLMFASPSRVRAWSLLVSAGLCHHIVKDWKPDPARCEIIVRRLGHLPDRRVSSTVAFAALVCDESPSRVSRIGRALRLSNRRCEDLVWLTRSLPAMRKQPDMELADLKTLMAHDRWADALLLLRAVLPATGSGLEPYNRLGERAARIGTDSIAPPPLLTGDDLIALGAKPGPPLGAALRAAYRAQLNERITTREEAEALARQELERRRN